MSEETKSAEVVKQEKVIQNGVALPKEGSKTRRVFEIADNISAKDGAPAKRGDVLAAAEAEGINTATAATQYGRWCKFHGVTKDDKRPAEKEEVPVEEAATVEEA